MNHFMLPRPSGNGHDTWDSVAGRATRYGSASMEQLINRILKAGGTRADLEVKIFGGGRVLQDADRRRRSQRDFRARIPQAGRPAGDLRRRGRYLPAPRAVLPADRPRARAPPDLDAISASDVGLDSDSRIPQGPGEGRRWRGEIDLF